MSHVAIRFEDLPGFLDKTNKKISKKLDKLGQSVARNINREVVNNTPVDTGLARSNWIVSVNGAAGTVRPPFAPLPQGTNVAKFKERANAGAAISGAESTILSYRPATTANGAINITNNIFYIERLNTEGKTRQVPAGWVQAAVKQGFSNGLKRSSDKVGR